MHPRASELIARLRLMPHPEGGFFREVFRSASFVRPNDRAERRALTTIYFLLPARSRSRWHRVASDEVWHFYEGDPLEILQMTAPGAPVTRSLLGAVGESTRPACTVPAGVWQAASPLGHYTLVGCTVGPGFEFEDFEMLADDEEAAARLRAQSHELAEFL